VCAYSDEQRGRGLAIGSTVVLLWQDRAHHRLLSAARSQQCHSHHNATHRTRDIVMRFVLLIPRHYATHSYGSSWTSAANLTQRYHPWTHYAWFERACSCVCRARCMGAARHDRSTFSQQRGRPIPGNLHLMLVDSLIQHTPRWWTHAADHRCISRVCTHSHLVGQSDDANTHEPTALSYSHENT